MEYFDRLVTDNSQKISNLLGEKYVEHSMHDTLKTDEVIEANEALSDSLYGPEVSQLVRTNDVATIDKMSVEVQESVSVSEKILDDLDTDKIGIVVIRPEAMDLGDVSRDFLVNNGLKVVLDKTTQINFHQYWSLYNPGLRDPDAKFDFPTRTLNYIDKDIRILVVAGADGSQHEESISTYITDHLKGAQGSFTEHTLRGDIAYSALRDLVTVDGEAFTTPRFNVALDPIGAYRELVRGTIVSDRMHATADSPLLFYAGQSMHVPDTDEIRRDVRILLTEEEIATVIEELQS